MLRFSAPIAALTCALAFAFGPVAAHAEPVVVEPEHTLPAVIDAVEIDGLWRTKPFVVHRELPWKKGQSVTLEQWALGVERLWNVAAFSRVEGRLERDGDRLVAHLVIEEKWTLMGILRGSAGGGESWWAAGLYDLNTLGRYLEVGAFYEQFGPRAGGEAWVRNPRFLEERQELAFVFGRHNRPRPGFMQERISGRVDVTRDVQERLRVGARLEFASDAFPMPPRRSDAEALVPVADSKTTTLAGYFRFGRVNPIRLRYDGASLELHPSLAFTTDPVYFAIGRFFAEALWFRSLGRIWNLGLRVQFAAQTPSPVQGRYFIGGLDLVRGMHDSELRTNLFALVNAEARCVAFDSMLLAIMPTAFVDGVVTRTEEGSAHGVLSTGVGVRVLVPRLVKAGIRIDAAWRLDEPALQPRLSLGVHQFF